MRFTTLPLYEYECLKSGHRFELIRKFSDPPVEKCIVCNSAVRRLLSAPAIAFKGKGWYVTDYARKGSGGNGSADGAKGSEPKPGSPPAPSGASENRGSKKVD